MHTAPMARYLEPSGAKRFYDGFGAKLDSQSFYEDPALDCLIALGDFENARNVMEFGCGTGRFAARLLGDLLPDGATYRGCDISDTMVALSRARLAEYGSRAQVMTSGEKIDFAAGSPPFDRLVSSFVLDLLPPELIFAFLSESCRALKPGGLLCVTNLTHGRSVVQKLVSTIWTSVANVRPSLVGGCRPIRFGALLSGGNWTLIHNRVVSGWGVPMEITIAKRI